MGGEGQLFIIVKFKLINIEGVMETLINTTVITRGRNCPWMLKLVGGSLIQNGMLHSLKLSSHNNFSVELPGRHDLGQLIKLSIKHSAT